ncbi:uncharacterized protein ColSpa_01946 [Colletotrichum spaethianum]|uniref:Uncharacterized protein n=1 Tax=Colletotrichum spaethianum TaxID=700344 RepID=A0AA37NWY0_9PEZI|nr:uncharacterized protein ColSpa_01946 [Colletotrichum spaethianum]GKT41765.1 hypothetical protein ColSpa_01946 [Colletotrichum spaethianum]
MASSHDAIGGSSDIAQGNSVDVNPPPDNGASRKSVHMSIDTYISSAKPIYPDGDLFVILLSHQK